MHHHVLTTLMVLVGAGRPAYGTICNLWCFQLCGDEIIFKWMNEAINQRRVMLNEAVLREFYCITNIALVWAVKLR